MYQNRIRRTTPKRHPQFFIRRSEIVFDERLAFVEHVLATLNESRFGPGGVYHSVLRSSGRPELEPPPLYDFDDNDPNGLIPCYALLPLGRKGHQCEKVQKRKREKAMRQSTNNFFTFSHFIFFTLVFQGRGSP